MRPLSLPISECNSTVAATLQPHLYTKVAECREAGENVRIRTSRKCRSSQVEYAD